MCDGIKVDQDGRPSCVCVIGSFQMSDLYSDSRRKYCNIYNNEGNMSYFQMWDLISDSRIQY